MVQQPVQPFNEEFKLNISVAEKLKTTRNDLSLSQARVASETGLRRSSISEAENGQRILTDDELNTLVDFYVQEGADPDFFNCDYSDDLNGEAEFSVTQCDGVLCAHSVAADVGLLESYANALADAENNVIKLLEAPVPSRRPLLSSDTYRLILSFLRYPMRLSLAWPERTLPLWQCKAAVFPSFIQVRRMFVSKLLRIICSSLTLNLKSLMNSQYGS